MWTTSQNARLPVPPPKDPKGKAIYGQVHTILATIAIAIGTIDWMCILNDYLQKNCLGCDSAALLIKSIQSHVGVMWRWKKHLYLCEWFHSQKQVRLRWTSWRSHYFMLSMSVLL